VLVVLDDGTVERRNIGPGPLVDGLRVVREGLAAGDWVVTRGLQRARPGSKVEPRRLAIAEPETGSPKGAETKAPE
jgi:multidrug efflux system membrane fusion protein